MGAIVDDDKLRAVSFMDERDDYQEPVNRSLISAELDVGRYRPRFRRHAPYWVTVAVFAVFALIIVVSLL